MGVIIAPQLDLADLAGDDGVIIRWWVPPVSKAQCSHGKRPMTIDLFGTWRPYDLLPVGDAEDYVIPAAEVPRSSIMHGPIELDDGDRLSYQTLDAITDAGRDLTGLSWTRTERGNAYRLYRLSTR